MAGEALTSTADCDLDFQPVSCMGCEHVLTYTSLFPVPELYLSAFIFGKFTYQLDMVRFPINAEVVIDKKPRKTRQAFKIFLARKIVSEEKGELL